MKYHFGLEDLQNDNTSHPNREIRSSKTTDFYSYVASAVGIIIECLDVAVKGLIPEYKHLTEKLKQEVIK